MKSYTRDHFKEITEIVDHPSNTIFASSLVDCYRLAMRFIRELSHVFNCDDSKVIGISMTNIFVWDSNTHKQTNIMVPIVHFTMLMFNSEYMFPFPCLC